MNLQPEPEPEPEVMQIRPHLAELEAALLAMSSSPSTSTAVAARSGTTAAAASSSAPPVAAVPLAFSPAERERELNAGAKPPMASLLVSVLLSCSRKKLFYCQARLGINKYVCGRLRKRAAFVLETALADMAADMADATKVIRACVEAEQTLASREEAAAAAAAVTATPAGQDGAGDGGEGVLLAMVCLFTD